MKQIIKDRKDIAFYIKLFPLRIHPTAYEKSKAIVCAKSMKMLEDAFEGKSIPSPSCKGEAVDATIRLAERLGITGAPAIILPDGTVVPGFKDAQTLIRLIDEASKPTL